MIQVGLDIGSTTVKAVALQQGKVIWRDYQRHDTKQPEKCCEFLVRIEQEFPAASFHVFITGSRSSVR